MKEYIATFNNYGLYSEEPLIRCIDCGHSSTAEDGTLICKLLDDFWVRTDPLEYCHLAVPKEGE